MATHGISEEQAIADQTAAQVMHAINKQIAESATVEAINEKIANHHAAFTRINTDVKSHNKRIQTLENDMNKAKGDIDQLSADVGALNEYIGQLDETDAAIKEGANGFKAALGTLNEKVAFLSAV